VLFYNTALNKSSEWGVLPWHWYASSALPRALHVALPLAVSGLFGLRRPNFKAPQTIASEGKDGLAIVTELGVCLFSGGIDHQLLGVVGPAATFTALYSFLPHKELRFIFPAIPLLTLAAAVGLSKLLPGDAVEEAEAAPEAKAPSARTRSARWVVAAAINAGLVLLLFLAVTANRLFWISAEHNYPGGHALKALVSTHIPSAAASTGECSATPITVHIGVDAAMSGVTRFWHEASVGVGSGGCAALIDYSKEEGLGAAELGRFDWLLVSPQEAEVLGLLGQKRFEVVETFYAFKKLSSKKGGAAAQGQGSERSVPVGGLPFRIDLSPAVLVMKRSKRQ